MENTPQKQVLENLIELVHYIESNPDIFSDMIAYKKGQPHWNDMASKISKFYMEFGHFEEVTEELEAKIEKLAKHYLEELQDFAIDAYEVKSLTKEGKKARKERIAAKKAQTQAEQERADLITRFITFLAYQSKNKIEYQDKMLKNFLPLIPKNHNEKVVYGDFEITRVNTVFAIFGDSGNKIVFRKIKK